jgi:hypothetical protein
MNNLKTEKKIIGMSTVIELLDFGVSVPCKVDTGCLTSAIHCQAAKVTIINGVETLECELLGHLSVAELQPIKLVTTEFSKISVVSMHGEVEHRYSFDLTIGLGGEEYVSRFSATNREHAGYPILIGRKALVDRFLVDVSIIEVPSLGLLKKNTKSLKWKNYKEVRESVL